MHLTAYLFFDGTCAEAFTHYAKLFGGHLVLMTPRGTPMESHCSPDQLDRIMHARIDAPGLQLMGGDAPSAMHRPMQGMSVNVMADTVADAQRVWAGLSEGAQVRMPLEETFWAERFGMLVDRFGTPWMVNCEKKMA